MKKIYYLSTCDTCVRIINELQLKEKGFAFQDVKQQPISAEDLDQIHEATALSYEELFNKRAIKYSKTELKQTLQTENQFRNAILNEYTFMKRPIIEIEGEYFVGNAKKTIEEAKAKI